VMDGIWSFSGSDYVTINGIDLQENAANTSAGPCMEFGYGFFKASGTDGCNHNMIQNCTVTLNRVNNAAAGTVMFPGCASVVMLNSTTAAMNTAVTVTAASGSNSNNQFYANTLQNCNAGIYMNGFAALTPFTLGDTGNDIGGSSPATGNNIINFGGGGIASAACAVQLGGQWGYNISYNTINNNDGSGVNHAGTLRGIYVNATGNGTYGTINNNTVTLKNNGTTTNSEPIHNQGGTNGINNTITMNNNTITNCTNANMTSGVWGGIWNDLAAPTNLQINNNVFSNNSTTTTSGLVYNINNSGAVTVQPVFQIYQGFF
jgi:hypothetical protein